MTDRKLTDVLNGQEENYMLPFYWMKGNTARIPEDVARIYQSGCRALCVESRPHPDFAGEGWWRDMDAILAEAKKYGMGVWILDDDHFPTGHANGQITKKHPELKQWLIGEQHIDVMGPQKDGAVLLRTLPGDSDRLLAVYAYPRSTTEQNILPEPMDLTDKVNGQWLLWDVPEGCWRIYFMYQTRHGSLVPEYIDMLRPESVRVLIDAVYEPHFAHYGSDFGKTIKGFFSDEPMLGNTWFSAHACEYRYYETRIGMAGMAYPWRNDKIPDMMREKLGYDPMPYLAALWNDMGDRTAEIRYAYMDAVTCLYRDCFTRQLGNWCREHGVMYIGHIIEDNNSHARLGHSDGHFFRSLDGQDMSGMDIVLHQIIPGMYDYIHTASSAWNYCDPAFFDYVLGKLASSFAHINPQMQGRAMCEVFGAYGWAEGVACMRYLLDYLLVRGINRFVPHAFSPVFPDGDCPPHFGAHGKDPQYEGFAKLMQYGNRVSHLLSDAVHHADVAILYHAEAEWINPNGKAMLTQVPAKLLYDSHIDYDILPMDCFLSPEASRHASVYPATSTKDGRLSVGNETYRCLILPAAEIYPSDFLTAIETLKQQGVTVYRMGENVDEITLVATLKRQFTPDVSIASDCPAVRVCHYSRGEEQIYMFVNESTCDRADTAVRFSQTDVGQTVLSWDLLHEETPCRMVMKNQTLPLSLEPGQSRMVFIHADSESVTEFPMYSEYANRRKAVLTWRIETASYDTPEQYTVFAENVTDFPSIAAVMPDFSGYIRYTAEFSVKDLPDADTVALYLPYVGQSVHGWLNEKDMGVLVNAPFRFVWNKQDLQNENKLTLIVSNTLANAIKDRFSTYMLVLPAGLSGTPEWQW